MATECWLNNAVAPTLVLHQQQQQQPQHQNNHYSHNQQQDQQHKQQQQTFVSANAYYGYVPVASSNSGIVMPPTSVRFDYNRNNGAMDVDVAMTEDEQRRLLQKKYFDQVEEERCVMRVRKRCLVQDEVAGYMQNFKRFREETVVTNIFSVVQESNGYQQQQFPQQMQQSSQNSAVDWPRCSMNRYYA